MFADFISRLAGAAERPLPEDDARRALAALMVRVARADGHFDAGEREQIERCLATRYALDAEAARALLDEGAEIEAGAPDTVRFTRSIKDAVAYENRLGVIEDLWQVALADGSRDAHEDSLLRLVSKLLGINDRDSALARQRIAAPGRET